MAALVTLAACKRGLRVDTSDDDTLLGLLIGAASASVITYLKDQADELIGDLEAAQNNSPSDADVPEHIQQATIVVVGYFYDPDGDADKTPGYLPPAAIALLHPYRTPTIA